MLIILKSFYIIEKILVKKGEKMKEEKKGRRCPAAAWTKLYRMERCNAPIVRKERLVSPESQLGYITGTDWGVIGLKEEEEREFYAGGPTDKAYVPFYIYECEKGHKHPRPEGWADVPEVPPGTIRSIFDARDKKYKNIGYPMPDPKTPPGIRSLKPPKWHIEKVRKKEGELAHLGEGEDWKGLWKEKEERGGE